MLISHVTSPATLARLQNTPCWPHLNGYTDWLDERHYSSSAIQLYLFGVISLGDWLADNSLVSADFNYEALVNFRIHRTSIHQYRYRGGKIKSAYRGAQRFHEYLVLQGITTGKPDPLLLMSPLQKDFEQWMSTHRGVCDVTLKGYSRYVSVLIDKLGEEPGLYSATTLRRFILDAEKLTSARRGTFAAMLIAVRSFLRYLVATGQCCSTLPAALPRRASWRLAKLPTVISPEEVQRLIESCAECPLTARRDRAALMLMWSLALRAGDIVNLELNDIDWSEARIRFLGKSKREVWLPLTQDVGDALIDYIQNERFDTSSNRLFIKSTAPGGPVDKNIVYWIVRRAIERTGIKAEACGPHLIRRSAATNMLRQDASLTQIGSILRHENVQTTQLYAKLDQELLLGVAATWPSCKSTGNTNNCEVSDISEQKSC